MKALITGSLAVRGLLGAVCGCALALSAACSHGTRAVRGEDEVGLDNPAMSTGLDRRDLQKMLDENMEHMRRSAVVQRWMSENRPAVTVLPMKNETSEHIDGPLQALISDVETKLIEWGAVKVISLENQQDMMNEIRRQYSEGFDQSQIAHWGKQIGARYFVTGKVYTTDERVGVQRRVQYYLFMQVLDVETGEILFQNKSAVTKAIVRD
jgi:penicillin-binding protein activator